VKQKKEEKEKQREDYKNWSFLDFRTKRMCCGRQGEKNG